MNIFKNALLNILKPGHAVFIVYTYIFCYVCLYPVESLSDIHVAAGVIDHHMCSVCLCCLEQLGLIVCPGEQINKVKDVIPLQTVLWNLQCPSDLITFHFIVVQLKYLIENISHIYFLVIEKWCPYHGDHLGSRWGCN